MADMMESETDIVADCPHIESTRVCTDQICFRCHLDGVPPTLTKGNFVTDTDTSNVSVVAKKFLCTF